MKILQCIFCYIGIGILCARLCYLYDKRTDINFDYDKIYTIIVFIWPLFLFLLCGLIFIDVVEKIIKE